MNNKTKEKVQKWIPVKSGKFPRNNASCWITVVDGKKVVVLPARYVEGATEGAWFVPNRLTSLTSKNVVAWMKYSQPKPYKEEGEGNYEKL